MIINKKIIKNELVNIQGNDANLKVVNGNSTNLFDFRNSKLSWVDFYYKQMLENFWIPEKNNVFEDKKNFINASEELKKLFCDLLSSVTFLDSIQSYNVVKLTDFITEPNINCLLFVQNFQEVIHSKSYDYMIKNVLTPEIYNEKGFLTKWKDNKYIYERNALLLNYMEKFFKNPNIKNLILYLLGNLALEGISFYVHFAQFYGISYKKGIFVGVCDIFRLIERDEITHTSLTKKILFQLIEEEKKYLLENGHKEFLEKNKENKLLYIDNNTVYEFFKKIFLNEIALLEFFFNYKKFDNCIGINIIKYKNFIKFLVNSCLIELELSPLFPEVKNNPLSYLNNIGNKKEDKVKSNFFETNVTKYKMSNVINDWEL